MILELREIYKDYQQGKLVVPVLKHVNFPWRKGNTPLSWAHPVPEKRL